MRVTEAGKCLPFLDNSTHKLANIGFVCSVNLLNVMTLTIFFWISESFRTYDLYVKAYAAISFEVI